MLKKYGLILIGLLALIALIMLYTPGKYSSRQEDIDQSCPDHPSRSLTDAELNNAQKKTVYEVKTFNFGAISGLSAKQLKEHNELYEGYVKKRNEIAQKLQTTPNEGQNRTYSAYRALKIAETYALNGSILHELYFENMSNKPSHIGTQMKALIENSFGSVEAFKEDLMAAALCSRGWVLTAYSLDDHLVHNYVLEEHNQTVPVLAMPLIVLDVYEHAYMIDFGIKRQPYLDVFWSQIDWNVAESRINKWVTPFKK